MLAPRGGEHALHLGSAQDHWQPVRRARPPDLLEPRQLDAEYLLVQEDECRERLLVSRDGRPALVGEPAEELLDFGRTHLPRVPEAGKAHEPAHPVDIGTLGAQAVMAVAQPFPDLVEQAGRVQLRSGRGGSGVHVAGNCNRIQKPAVKPPPKEARRRGRGRGRPRINRKGRRLTGK